MSMKEDKNKVAVEVSKVSNEATPKVSSEASKVSQEAPKLSKRLAALAGLVKQGARFADIGTDHALLPVHLALSGTIAYAVAGDVNAGPAEAARRQVLAAGVGDIVSVRHGDGLSVLAPDEVDTVCIAGMGGSLMVRLLEEAGDALSGVTTLILSPHVAEDQVRRWLEANRYVLELERLVEEDGEIYTLLRAERAASAASSEAVHAALYDAKLLGDACQAVPADLLYEMGPLLLRSPDKAFMAKWRGELAKRERIAQGMKQSEAADTRAKLEVWTRTTKDIEEVLACLQGERRSPN
ncbi:tRNA (adenine(22)-N(1))-methyltransferase [Cohnella rhizosphaerae]|uniref:Class I SAM-dependent methyltransferase n=1 Tax=Cohnella rhizosphaerae TaxID=1457232 RepID=A0A9X4KWN7_9BACL|nr:class I SAM-dependent methyltransferase [Cohnella rhizosphaerae]MDG0812163.1 class I SAM-dependent methyltransferase [Cohnella rhizosphaerae]